MIAAFITGLIGSLHCLGMCGPIAMALPGGQAKGFQYVSGRVLYNLGRISTYSVLGALVSLFGVAAAMFAFQRWVSLGLGVVMLILAMRSFGLFGKKATQAGAINQWWMRQMGNLMRFGHGRGLFMIGLLNGILPCGFVYLGLFQAAVSDTVYEGAAKMALFGLGTVPVMLTISLTGNWLMRVVKFRPTAIMPSVMLVMGILFMLRGMALGIPYVSPKMEVQQSGKVKMSCCEKIEREAKSPRKAKPEPQTPQTSSEGKP